MSELARFAVPGKMWFLVVGMVVPEFGKWGFERSSEQVPEKPQEVCELFSNFPVGCDRIKQLALEVAIVRINVFGFWFVVW